MSIVYHGFFFSVLQNAIQTWLPHDWWCVVLPIETLHIAHGAQQRLEKYELSYQTLEEGEGESNLTPECATPNSQMTFLSFRWILQILFFYFDYYSYTLLWLLFSNLYLYCREFHCKGDEREMLPRTNIRKVPQNLRQKKLYSLQLLKNLYPFLKSVSIL